MDTLKKKERKKNKIYIKYIKYYSNIKSLKKINLFKFHLSGRLKAIFILGSYVIRVVKRCVIF